MLTEDQILTQLKGVKYPGFSRDIVSFGLVKGVSIERGGEVVTVHLAVTTGDKAVPEQLHAEASRALLALPGVVSVDVQIALTAPLTAATQAGAGGAGSLPQTAIEGVKHVIAVGSGKGGVGKSTVAANLALALQLEGYRTGLCDCDIYGPSIPLMFGVNEAPMATEDNRIMPIEQYGLQLMSMGFLLEDDAPAVLRGPMVTRYTQQFLRHVAWSNLDYLILDLPPGTGDIQLTIVQTVALTGAIVVTTPQEVALIDARKAASMFHKVNVRVLGILENMSYFISPTDGHRHDIFGAGGGNREAERLGVPLLGEIPLEITIRQSGDAGHPIVGQHPESPSAQAFRQAAKAVIATTQRHASPRTESLGSPEARPGETPAFD